jgi:hypothetical protein
MVKKCGYTEILKTYSGYPLRQFAGFFMSTRRMIAENILNIGRPLYGFSESATSSKLKWYLKRIGVKMNNIVKFNDVEVALINHNNQKYIALSQIVTALETTHNHIAQIYTRHKSEFELDMTCLIRKGNTRIRIFNREGAWLIGMFARTPKAAEFRKWVLKVLGAVADNLSPTDKPVIVSEHTRSLPSPKKEIVLSEKAKQEIGGIVKAVVGAALTEQTQPTLFAPEQTVNAREELKSLMREVIREEIAPFLLSDGLQRRKELSRGVEADGLPYINWIIGIMHSATALQICMDKMQQRNKEAVELLTAMGAV